MIKTGEIAKITEWEDKILRVLLYFDIFNYPLTAQELERFTFLAPTQIAPCMVELRKRGFIFKLNEYYGLQNDISVAIRRQNGNKLAEQRMMAAKKFSAIIHTFPFVRAVLLSGSISKGYMDENSDIDYFIITSPGRLWLVRTLLVLFRRAFLFNSRRNFCTNYFVTTGKLEIQEKNIFTALEITTLLSMTGIKICSQFMESNKWSEHYFPYRTHLKEVCEEREPWFKRVGEKLLSFSWMDKIERHLMNYSIQRWKKTYGHSLNAPDFNIAFQSTPHVSRSHPEFYQKKVLNLYQQKIKAFEQQHHIAFL